MVTSKDVAPTVIKRERKLDLPTPPALDPAEQILMAAKQMQEAMRKLTGGKVVMKMERDNATFLTEGGVLFSQEHPYQLVEAGEAELLIAESFRAASPEEILQFYGK